MRAEVDLRCYIHYLEVLLVLSPYRVFGEFLIFLSANAYFQLAHVAACKEVFATDYEVLGAKSHLAVCIVAVHYQVQSLQIGTAKECRVGNCHRHAGIHLTGIHVLELHGLYLVLSTECVTAYSNSLVVVGTADIVIQFHCFLVLNICYIHMIDSMLTFCHQPLSGQSPSRLTAGLVSQSVGHIAKSIDTGNRGGGNAACHKTIGVVRHCCCKSDLFGCYRSRSCTYFIYEQRKSRRCHLL